MNRMIPKLALLLVLLMTVFGMNANPVDMRTAQEVAVKFMNANAKTPLRGTDELQLVSTYTISRGEAAFYVFNTPNGFVIVSADDCATPILGYSDEGQFDMENIPIQLQDYLQGFVEQIEYGIENQLEADEKTAHEWELVRRTGRLNENRDGEVVEPLITAMWGQSCYYNAMCPEDENGPCGHCVTGCVATAMGVILHYWGYPAQGTSSHSYLHSTYGLISANFGETTYDWANMPNQLNATSTQAEIDAVSTLLWHCGVAVNMGYSPNASGAVSNSVPDALLDYFNYSNDMHWENRQDDESWVSLLKTDLDAGRPVFYGGSNINNEGHAFVCDGYDVNDRFHFNWGWNGSSNGYFALNDIGFIYYNHAIFNLHPNANITHQVTTSTSPFNGGTISGAGTYDKGSICTLTATANEGYTFMYWTEDDEVVSTQSEYSFRVRKDRDLIGHFSMPIQVEVVLDPMGGGTVSGAGEYAYGSTCTLTATPNEGYDFICWRKTNGSVVTTASTYTFTVTEATTLTAVFAVSGGEQIAFADLNVKAICVSHWDTNGDGELSYNEAAVVTDLGQAFRENTEITSFEELQYFTGLTTISNYAFLGCSGLTGSLYIPNSVTSIGNYAFSGCSGFTGSLTIPNSVTTIGQGAFEGCSGFTGSLIIPTSVTTISGYVFHDCSGFTGSLTIPNSVTTIGTWAFAGCSGFTGSLTIPNSVTTIGNDAFYNCSGFNGSLTIPNSVTTIGMSAFEGCSGFTGRLIIPNSVTTIEWCAFRYCSGFTGSLTIPNSVTTIHYGAFLGCSGFTGDLIIPNSVTEIGNSAFYGCSSFTGSLTIGNAVTSIGNYAFFDCSSFTSVTLPNSVTSIGEYAFYNCSGFTSVYYTGSIAQWCSISFYYGSNPLCYAHNLHINNSLVTNLTIPSTITEIKPYAFYEASCLTSLTIPNTVALIGDCAFHGCSGFTGNLEIPNSVTTIGHWAFDGCSGFTGSLAIPNSVTQIGQAAFQNCSGFTGSLTIPNSVTTIGNYAFYGCSGFTGSLTIPNSVTLIGNATFYNCSGFTGNLTIPNSVTEIGGGAFYHCSGFTGSLIIPNSVTKIGGDAFYGCSGFTGNLTIPNSVTEIGGGAFYSCSGFTGDLTIPNSLTIIGSWTFGYCIGFTGSLTIGNSVTTIGDYAFNGCIHFTSIVSLAETPPLLLADNIFWGNSNIPVYVPCGFEEVYSSVSWGGFGNFRGLCAGEITVTANPTQGGTVIGAGYYEGGASCTLIATVNTGYIFINWEKDGVWVSNSETYSFIVAGDASYVANFVEGSATISFADTNVKALCVANWDTNSDGELSYAEAAAVTDLGQVFNFNSNISSFNELWYFTGLTFINGWEFSDCHGLTSIKIPHSVTTIGWNAFNNCYNLTSLEIPNSVTYMATNPFEGCSGLEQVIVEEGNLVYDSRDNCNAIIKTRTNELVTGCKNTVIPNSVISIGHYAFSFCRNLTSVEIPNSVTSIYTSAFDGCRSLTSIIILADNPPTLLFGNAFFIEIRDIPVYVPCESKEAYTAVNWGGFNNIIGMCEGEITATANPAEGGTVTGGGYYEGGATCTLTATANDGYSFVNWTKNGMLVSNSDTCTFIVAGDASYVANFSLTGNWNLPIQFADVNVKALCVANWDTNGDGELSYAEAAAVTNLGEVFKRKYSITSFDELQYFISLTSIDSYAFYECYNLASVIIPSSVTSIGSYAFAYCRNLTSVEIPNSVTFIGGMAFEYCHNLTSVEIPNSVTSIGTNPFESCSGLEQIVVASGNSFYDSRDNCNAIIQTSTNSLIVGCKNTIIPNTVTTIKEYAFWGCEGLISIEIPNSVTTIGYDAFYSCNNLSSVEISNSVTTIGGNAFCGCSGLTSVEIPNSVTSIGWGAFSGCSGLTIIEIPNSVTSMGSNPFQGCSGLEQIIVDAGNMVYDSRGGCNAIIKTSTNELVTGCKNAIIPNFVTSIGESAFDGCIGLISIEIPNSIISIGSYAFESCYNLTSMIIRSDNTPVLGNYVFYNVNPEIPVYVPCGSLEAYSAANWGGFNNFIEVCDVEISVTANPEEGGTITGAGTFAHGETCTLTATANPGYTFFNWTEDGTHISYNPNYSFIVRGDRNLVANFMEGDVCDITFDLYDSYGDGYTGNYLVVSYGDVTEQLTVESGSFASHTLYIPNGSHVTLTWISGSYPEDCSFTVSYSSGDIIYHGENLNGDFMYEFDVNCGGSSDTIQTVNLSQGWNNISIYLAVEDPVAMLDQLKEGLGENALTIEGSEGYTEFDGEEWFGDLDELGITNEQSYMINVLNSCTVELEGMPANPTDYEISISQGWNRIGFPSAEELEVAVALSEFAAEEGDMLEGPDGYTEFDGEEWFGDIEMMVPGMGYQYFSNSDEPKTLVFHFGRKGNLKRK